MIGPGNEVIYHGRGVRKLLRALHHHLLYVWHTRVEIAQDGENLLLINLITRSYVNLIQWNGRCSAQSRPFLTADQGNKDSGNEIDQ